MKNNSKAFTVIELLVVIAIISLLSSMIYASVSTAREKAAVAKSQVQGKNIEKGIEIARDVLMASSASVTDTPYTNTSIETPLSRKPKIAKAIYQNLEPLSESAGTGQAGGETTQVGDAVPRVPRGVNTPDTSVDDDGDEYYYFSNGLYSCYATEDFGCLRLRCGNPSTDFGAHLADDYVVAFKIDTTDAPPAPFGPGPTPENTPGYDPANLVMYTQDNGNSWTGLPWLAGIYPNNRSGPWQCI